VSLFLGHTLPAALAKKLVASIQGESNNQDVQEHSSMEQRSAISGRSPTPTLDTGYRTGDGVVQYQVHGEGELWSDGSEETVTEVRGTKAVEGVEGAERLSSASSYVPSNSRASSDWEA